ncbi:hypothetical protein BJA01nite_21860 [Bradyrhizobium japonicum]|nr:hypothetical protein BJ6T_43260 [Bradyrhizobium japonicum USDA 6]GEC44544.1 hypothetical protein BJA01nite_21860 [Bradyrhizobium japonicum]
MVWDSPAKSVPLDAGDPQDEESEPEEFPWAGASLTERWWYIAYGMEDVEWTPFDDDPPGRPGRSRARQAGVGSSSFGSSAVTNDLGFS